MSFEALMPLVSTEGESLGALGAFLLGMSMGLTACTVTCLPFIGTWVMGRGRGGKAAAGDATAFLAGRVLAYGLLGLLAGLSGERLAGWLTGAAGNLAIGLASCMAAVWLLHGALPRLRPLLAPQGVALNFHPRRPAARAAVAGAGCAPARRADALPPFFLGAALSLTPCAPLGWLLTVCALSGSALSGLGSGLLFGTGAALSPLLVLLPLFGSFGRTLVEERRWLAGFLSAGAALVLLGLGVRRLLLI